MKNSYTKHTSEIEYDYHRNLAFGYELEDSMEFLKCNEHGAPHPLIRWHHHEEYELHLITASKGKMFVGDYIGDFQPGNLVLTGPHLPHNWVSNELPEVGIPSRDISLQFLDEPFRKACELLPEMSQVLPLLDRARYGIEFFDISDYAKQQLLKIKNKKGIFSFIEFLVLMSILSNHTNYQLLSDIQINSAGSEERNRFSEIIDYINSNYCDELSMTDIADQKKMELSSFSRSFKKTTGVTFTSFVNRVRINRACRLLTETDEYISTIAYRVGYNNVANFNRRFVEIKKVTPTQYRKTSQFKFN